MACSRGGIAPQGSAPSPLNPGMLVSGQNFFAEAAGADGAEQSWPCSAFAQGRLKSKTVKWRGGKGMPSTSPDTCSLQY